MKTGLRKTLLRYSFLSCSSKEFSQFGLVLVSPFLNYPHRFLILFGNVVDTLHSIRATLMGTSITTLSCILYYSILLA